MREHSGWGDCFPMAGIGGAPFVGKTGFGAFSAHVPDDGTILILFGPHIAISEAGELGQYLRIGQTKHSTACGAALGAYAQCKHSAAASVKDDFDSLDTQMDWLRLQVAQCLERIDNADEPLNELMYAVFEAIKAKMAKIVNTKFGVGRLVLIGGIQINMPAPYIDHFMPLQFDVLSSQDDPVDLLQYLVWDGANLGDLGLPHPSESTRCLRKVAELLQGETGALSAATPTRRASADRHRAIHPKENVRYDNVYRHVHRHVHGHVCGRVFGIGMPLESSRRDRHFEHQHAYTRAAEMPSAMPMPIQSPPTHP